MCVYIYTYIYIYIYILTNYNANNHDNANKCSTSGSLLTTALAATTRTTVFLLTIPHMAIESLEES